MSSHHSFRHNHPGPAKPCWIPSSDRTPAASSPRSNIPTAYLQNAALETPPFRITSELAAVGAVAFSIPWATTVQPLLTQGYFNSDASHLKWPTVMPRFSSSGRPRKNRTCTFPPITQTKMSRRLANDAGCDQVWHGGNGAAFARQIDYGHGRDQRRTGCGKGGSPTAWRAVRHFEQQNMGQ